ncbi:MAG: DUF2124 family protein [Candidatus Verstraetearchaeota archaeon]|nr:DUF2124 family protein [Candidatus Verstraetearchaeota archaeon]
MSARIEAKGLVGLSRCFRDAVHSTRKEGRILFVGTPFTCLPFAEFLCYGIRDLALKPFFMPGNQADKIREIVKMEGYGYQLGAHSKESHYDIVVLLGGLGMPKYGLPPAMLQEVLSSISDKENIIAVCFQGTLKSIDWTGTFRFKFLINSDLMVTME